MNRTIAIIALIALTWGTELRSEAIVIDGFYQGKDLYVKNPNGPKGVGFCVYEVQVNGDITADEINSSAFIVDLHVMGLKIGDPVSVKIIHHGECRPKVLNPEAVLPQSTFETTALQVDEQGVLNWETKNEMGELPFIVQQYKWNKWVKIGEVIGTGRMDHNQYSFQLEAHSGRNIYRIGQMTSKGRDRYTEEVVYNATDRNPVKFESEKVSDIVSFSDETHYEIFDEYGRLVKRGFDQHVNVATLDKGLYYINYDARFGESFSKR